MCKLCLRYIISYFFILKRKKLYLFSKNVECIFYLEVKIDLSCVMILFFEYLVRLLILFILLLVFF